MSIPVKKQTSTNESLHSKTLSSTLSSKLVLKKTSLVVTTSTSNISTPSLPLVTEIVVTRVEGGGETSVIKEDEAGPPPLDVQVVFSKTSSEQPESPVIPSPDTKLEYKKVKNLGGDNGAELYKSVVGDAFIVWKPASGLVADAETAGSKLANFVTGGLVPVAVPMEQPEGTDAGLAQTFAKMAPFRITGSINKKTVDLSIFSIDQLAELFVHAIGDWICSNWDTHSGNFGIGANSRIIAIDKGQSFKFFTGEWGRSKSTGFTEPLSMDLTKGVTPRRPDVLVYPSLAAFLKDHQDDGRAPNADHDSIANAIDRVENLKRGMLDDCLGAYAASAFSGSENAFLQAVLFRAKAIAKACEPYVGRRKEKTQVQTSLVVTSESKIEETSTESSETLTTPTVTLVETIEHPLAAKQTHIDAFQRKLETLGGVESFARQVAQDLENNERTHGLKAPSEFESLSEIEKIAVWNYTRQYFQFWNPALRNDAGRYSSKYLGAHEAGIRVCTSALLKLPAYSGKSYRVEAKYKDRHDAASVDAIFDWYAFSSTGFNIEFLRGSEFAGAVEWHIRAGHRGRLVDFISASPQEGEVLFPPGTRMRVVGRNGDARKRQIVTLELEEVIS